MGAGARPRSACNVMPTAKSWARWSALVAALLLLNASLTFQNAWPTPAVRWQNALSIELAALVLALAWFRGRARAALARPLRK